MSIPYVLPCNRVKKINRVNFEIHISNAMTLKFPVIGLTFSVPLGARRDNFEILNLNAMTLKFRTHSLDAYRVSK